MMSALTQHPEPVTEINWPLSIAALVIGLCILVPAIVRWIKSRRGQMNDWQQFLIVLAIASGILAAVSLFGRVKALEKAAKAAPVTPDKPPVDPFTAEDVVAFLDREATQREGWATQARLLAEGGISRDMNVSLAKDYGRDVSMFRCAAQRLRATIAAEEVA